MRGIGEFGGFIACNSLNVLIILFSMGIYSFISYASVNIPLDSTFYTDVGTLIAQG